MFLVTTKGHSAPGNLALLSKSIGYSSSSLFCKTDCKVKKKNKKKNQPSSMMEVTRALAKEHYLLGSKTKR